MATIKDVAKRAGVSIATVSYVMNNDLRISEATAKKVRQAAEELNYLASGIARSLKKAKTDNVLVLVHRFSGTGKSVTCTEMRIRPTTSNVTMVF